MWQAANHKSSSSRQGRSSVASAAGNEQNTATSELRRTRLVRAYRTVVRHMSNQQASAAVHILRHELGRDEWIRAFHSEDGELPPVGHRATVRRLAYLTLIATADMAQAWEWKKDQTITKEDDCYAGLLPVFENASKDEDEEMADDEQEEDEEDQRKPARDPHQQLYQPATTPLQVYQNYLDALALDPTDPVVWLKLARCAAGQPVERLALEKASSLVRPFPHRRITRALETARQRRRNPSVLKEPPERVTPKVVTLPKADWITLLQTTMSTDSSTVRSVRVAADEFWSWDCVATFLSDSDILACRATCQKWRQRLPALRKRRRPARTENTLVSTTSVADGPQETAADDTAMDGTASDSQTKETPVGMELSRENMPDDDNTLQKQQMPTEESPEDKDASEKAVRTDEEGKTEDEEELDDKKKQETAGSAAEDKNVESNLNPPPPNPAADEAKESDTGEAEGAKKEGTDDINEENDDDNDKPERPTQRSSKRLRTQELTSGKRSERESRRFSVGYCLLASVLGCNAESAAYRAAVGAPMGKKTKRGTSDLDKESTDLSSHTYGDAKEMGDGGTKEKMAVVSFSRQIGESSTRVALLRTVANISLHVDQVYPTTSNSTSSLETVSSLNKTMLQCHAWLSHNNITMSKLNNSCVLDLSRAKQNALSALELFAVDIMFAEVILASCTETADVDLDFDSPFLVAYRNTSFLVSALADVEKLVPQAEHSYWCALKTRCLWLHACIQLKRSKLNQSIVDSRREEAAGLGVLSDTMSFLRKSNLNRPDGVSTPHLVSSTRHELHWKKLSQQTLCAFESSIRAASALKRSKAAFLAVVARWDPSDSFSAVRIDDLQKFEQIGTTIRERYDDAHGRLSCNELIDDFLSTHGENLLDESEEDEDENMETLSEWFGNVVPVAAQTPSREFFASLHDPCILSIFVSCLQASSGANNNVQEVLCVLLFVCNSVIDMLNDARARFKKELKFLRSVASDYSEDGSNNMGRSALKNDPPGCRFVQHCVLLRLILERIGDLCKTNAEVLRTLLDKIEQVLSDSLCIWTWLSSSFLSESWCLSCDDDKMWDVCRSLHRLMCAACAEPQVLLAHRNYGQRLCEFLVEQRFTCSALLRADCNRQGNLLRLRLIRQRARIIARVSSELGLLLSKHPCEIEGSSTIFTFASARESAGSEHVSFFARTCEALTWFHQALKKTRGANFDRYCVELLRVPLASAIIAFCASASSSSDVVLEHFPPGENVDGDMYDSDSSVVKATSDKTGLGSYRGKLAKVAHCVANVLKTIKEKEAAEYSHFDDYSTELGPGLPVVAVRVLHFLADGLLSGSEDESNALWEDYSYGTRLSGKLVDDMLHTEYNILYGFTLQETRQKYASKIKFLPEGWKCGRLFSVVL